jgi:Kef-type K+ transport system membrane component KefB
MALILLTLGGLFLGGLAMHELGRRTRLPRVTLLMLMGVLSGPSGLDLLPEFTSLWFPLVSHVALSMVGFLLGGRLTRALLREQGRQVVSISIAAVLTTVAVVSAGLALLGVSLPVALLLGSVATATAPAASIDVVREIASRGRFSEILLGIVALDDAWSLILFSMVLAAVQTGGSSAEVLLGGAWNLAGAVALGAALGLPMAYLTGRIQPGEPTLAEALGLVFLSSGLALWFDVSFLLTSMVLGAVVANLAKHHTRPFHEIDNVEWPFMILFFVLAGAALDLSALRTLGSLTVAYIGLRIGGRLLGGWLGARAGGADVAVRRWIGLGLMPQAGVALGMALIATQRLPATADVILPVVIASTLLFEILGPMATRLALNRADAAELEAGKA